MGQVLLPSHAAGHPGSRWELWEGDITHVGFLLEACSNRAEIAEYAWIRHCPRGRLEGRAVGVSTREIRQNAAGLK